MLQECDRVTDNNEDIWGDRVTVVTVVMVGGLTLREGTKSNCLPWE